MNVWQFVVDTLGGAKDPSGGYVYERVRVSFEDGGGYYTETSVGQGGVLQHVLHVPRSKKELNWPRKLTVRHEVAHVIFSEMLRWSTGELYNWVNKEILRHKVWCWILKVYHWNKTLRRIRGWFGYTYDIDYDRDDLMPPPGQLYTREENELFCDWFAIKVKKWKEERWQSLSHY